MNSTKISNIKAKTTQPSEKSLGERSAAQSTEAPVVASQNKQPKFKVDQKVKAKFGPMGNARKNFTIETIQKNKNGKFQYRGLVTTSKGITTNNIYTIPENRLINA